jgi:hypothetical protein
VKPVRVVEASRLLVADEGVVLPTVPQRLDCLDVLMRSGVAFDVCGLFIAIEVARRVVARRSHDVPAGPTIRQKVEGRKFTC